LLASFPILVVLPSGLVRAATLRLRQVRHWTAPDHTRLVIELDAATRFSTRLLSDAGTASRLVIEIPAAVLPDGRGEMSVPVGDGLVKQVHAYVLGQSLMLRVELEQRAEYDAFPLAPDSAGASARIVVDVRRTWSDAERSQQEREIEAVRRSGDIVVAIDAGHGGNDPGCLGHGIIEKDVALSVARQLATALAGRPRLRTILTRDRDYFVPLGRRQQIARRYGAHVFVSIHANSAPSPSARGPEVFFVSLQGAADRAAKELVDRENAADLVGGVASEQVRTPVLDILVDLKQKSAIRRSERLGECVLKQMAELPGGEDRGLKQGPLAVLKSIDAASVLVELGFVTNKQDAGLMRDPAMHRRYARQMARAVDDYLASGL
jgi:N-acetylmuramoyl-L-alanine amidase